MINMNLKYRDPLDLERATAHWGQATFGTSLKEPTLYLVDHSFGYEYGSISGTHELYEVEVSDQVRSGARIAYTVYSAPLRAPLPVPPREVEFPYIWENPPADDEYHVPTLPHQVDLWCHLELASFEVRMIGDAFLCSAEYTYQYSFEAVFSSQGG